MANNVSNVVAGKPLVIGGVWASDRPATLPTDAVAALDGDFLALGYVSEDGLTEATDRSTDKVRAWGGDTVKVLQTEFATTYSFTLIEATNGAVLETVYGADNVTTTPASANIGTRHVVLVNADQLPHKAFVFEIQDGDARLRIVVPDGQVTEVGEVTYSDGDVIGYEVTVEAFRDSTLNANAVKYFNDGVPAAPAP